MAVDQAIAESTSNQSQAGRQPPPTLRWYTWNEPTLSLGYFQSAQDASPRFDDLACVRRSTGGGAILHHHELTYSLTLPCGPGEHGARADLYQNVHAAVASELTNRGVPARPFRLNKRPPEREDRFLCFQRRTDEDLIMCGYKILGSAQRRSKRAILQHGSLLLRASEHATELPGIFDLTSLDLSLETLANCLTKRIAAALGIRFDGGELSPEETRNVRRIEQERFATDTWWSRR